MVDPMSSLRRQANRASDWLVRAVLLGRQFHGRWKLVREQRAPFQGQRRNCNHIGDRLPARVTGVMGGMAPTADSRVNLSYGKAPAVLNYHERIRNKIASYRTRKDSNFRPSSIFATMFQIEKCWKSTPPVAGPIAPSCGQQNGQLRLCDTDRNREGGAP